MFVLLCKLYHSVVCNTISYNSTLFIDIDINRFILSIKYVYFTVAMVSLIHL